MDFHGGNIYKIFREKNIKEILDYSSNINPYGVPESLKQKIIENKEIIGRLEENIFTFDLLSGNLKNIEIKK